MESHTLIPSPASAQALAPSAGGPLLEWLLPGSVGALTGRAGHACRNDRPEVYAMDQAIRQAPELPAQDAVLRTRLDRSRIQIEPVTLVLPRAAPSASLAAVLEHGAPPLGARMTTIGSAPRRDIRRCVDGLCR
ncbi:hypothetical protein [Marichromatium bheemlicum]|uniref:Uncharacterized protein n=1 Tax=Marichromatium bheemlicum TaxID=365339 RepID=A0ABX1IAS7_9GAMM|nr:hypothetical protein [Marichromatium bheemlicum]NKN33971.1 hypothetical protein [Marichromatium bheemlicum]